MRSASGPTEPGAGAGEGSPGGIARRPGETQEQAQLRRQDAIAALERVRAQLARTQRTLDAFVDQIAAQDGSSGSTPSA